MNIFYHLGLWLYAFVVRLISPFNTKAHLFAKGRKNIFKRLREAIPESAQVAWFHCSSLGEFEQGRPVIEVFREAYPHYKILLTFFSPSGYEVRKSYQGADWVFYLPLDTARNARRFMDAVHPAVAVFIKYEFWYNFLQQLRKREIPTYLVSAIFNPSQPFFKWYGSFFRRMLPVFRYLFVQNEVSRKLLHTIGMNNVEVTGDTRFDRVVKVAEQAKELPLLQTFCAGKPTLVVGSSWRADEEKIVKALSADHFSNIKLVLVPHEVDEEHIVQMKKMFASYNPVCYTHAQQNDGAGLADARVLIVDTIGLLSSIYRYGTVAYIGGGFGTGIHNILEAAVYGMPVVFGPNYQRFQEAVDMLALHGAVTYASAEELKIILSTWLFDVEKQSKAGSICKDYVQQHTGATASIMQKLASLIK